MPIEQVLSGQKIEGWYDLKEPRAMRKGKPIKAQVSPLFPRLVPCTVGSRKFCC